MDRIEDDMDLVDPYNMAARLEQNKPKGDDVRDRSLGGIFERLTGEDRGPMGSSEFAANLDREQREEFVEGWGDKLLDDKKFSGTSGSLERRRLD